MEKMRVSGLFVLGVSFRLSCRKNTKMDLRLNFLKQAPAAAAMEKLFSGLVNVMFSVKSPEGLYLTANQAFLLRVGLSKRDELVGKTTRDVFPAAIALGIEQQDRDILAGASGIYDRLEVVTNADRSLGWYITDKVPVYNHRQRIIAVASTTRDLKVGAGDDSVIPRIVKFVDEMRKRFDEPIRISELAGSSGMSQAKLERKMRSIMSTSPRELLTRIRVEAASELLSTSRLSLSEVAYRCGFYDQATFCRQFKRLTGQTPGKYRRDHPGPVADKET